MGGSRFCCFALGRGWLGVLCFHSTTVAEAASIREALEFCLLQDFDDVIIKFDAKAIVQMIRNELAQDFRLECILSDIESLARRLQFVSFDYVPRESNHTAHSVAKFVFKEERAYV